MSLDSLEPISPYIPYSLGNGSISILSDTGQPEAPARPFGFAGLGWTPPVAAKGNTGKKKARKAKKAAQRDAA